MLPEKYLFKHDPWKVRDTVFSREHSLQRESVFSLGNGYMAMRGSFEEGIPAGSACRTNPAFYIAGIFDRWDDNTHIMKGRDVYPRSKQDMKNFPGLLDVGFSSGRESFTMAGSSFSGYARTLDMKEGTLSRELLWKHGRGRRTHVVTERFFSLDNSHVAAARYSVTPLNYSGRVSFEFTLGRDGSPAADSWRPLYSGCTGRAGAAVMLGTEQTGQSVAAAVRAAVRSGGGNVPVSVVTLKTKGGVRKRISFTACKGTEYVFEKLVAVYTGRDRVKGGLVRKAEAEVSSAARLSYARLRKAHVRAWERFWEENDVVIEGDAPAQQGMRFALFTLRQAYTGDDPRINIGSKGLASGQQYYWDSETYILPSLIYRDPRAARNLMKFRYLTLDGARKAARRWGYPGAKYPWITFDGDDIRHPYWDCVIGEIHINVAVSYGIYNYAGVTGDGDFLAEYGAEILVETARFWAERTGYSKHRRAYVINRITGPDEYAPFVNNNCYTNTMVKWSLEYTMDVIRMMKRKYPKQWRKLARKLSFKDAEMKKWKDIARRMFIPFDRKLGIHPQDDSFLELEHVDVSKIPDSLRCLEDKVPFEKTMRWDVIKQPDVVLLMYLLGEKYPKKVKKANYDFYEPKTIHDSSLSPCLHSVMASELGYRKDAYRFFLRSVRIDLDNLNNNTRSGLHTASTSGSWMAVVNGFAGLRCRRGALSFDPALPAKWKSCSFNVRFRGRKIDVEMRRKAAVFTLSRGTALKVSVRGKGILLRPGVPVNIP